MMLRCLLLLCCGLLRVDVLLNINVCVWSTRVLMHGGMGNGESCGGILRFFGREMSWEFFLFRQQNNKRCHVSAEKSSFFVLLPKLPISITHCTSNPSLPLQTIISHPNILSLPSRDFNSYNQHYKIHNNKTIFSQKEPHHSTDSIRSGSRQQCLTPPPLNNSHKTPLSTELPIVPLAAL